MNIHCRSSFRKVWKEQVDGHILSFLCEEELKLSAYNWRANVFCSGAFKGVKSWENKIIFRLPVGWRIRENGNNYIHNKLLHYLRTTLFPAIQKKKDAVKWTKLTVEITKNIITVHLWNKFLFLCLIDQWKYLIIISTQFSQAAIKNLQLLLKLLLM